MAIILKIAISLVIKGIAPKFGRITFRSTLIPIIVSKTANTNGKHWSVYNEM